MPTDAQMLAPPRGMRDFYPEDMRLRNRIFDAWRQASLTGGFSHYDACVVETLDLLERKAGEEIVHQIYAFEDKSGRRLALRPEMTPTLARMVAAHQGSLRFPIKWFTIAQCFRYERMTRGRKREHYQWNLDIVGEPDVGAEVEVLNTAVLAMRAMGVPDNAWRIHINNRALLAALLNSHGIAPKHHAAVFMVLDKRGKVPDDALSDLLTKAGIAPQEAGRILQLRDLETLDDVASITGRDAPALLALHTLFERLDAYALGPLCRFDLGVIRGLAYYTGIVFEAFDAARTSRAIFGGGRYDNLLSQVGGADQSAVGLGFGDVVVADLLNSLAPPAGEADRTGMRIGFMTEAERLPAMKLAARLRQAGEAVDLLMAPQRPKPFFTQANKAGIADVVLVGPDDCKAGKARCKHLATGSETLLDLL